MIARADFKRYLKKRYLKSSPCATRHLFVISKMGMRSIGDITIVVCAWLVILFIQPLALASDLDASGDPTQTWLEFEIPELCHQSVIDQKILLSAPHPNALPLGESSARDLLTVGKHEIKTGVLKNRFFHFGRLNLWTKNMLEGFRNSLFSSLLEQQPPVLSYLLECRDKGGHACGKFFDPKNEAHLNLYCSQTVQTRAIEYAMSTIARKMDTCTNAQSYYGKDYLKDERFYKVCHEDPRMIQSDPTDPLWVNSFEARFAKYRAEFRVFNQRIMGEVNLSLADILKGLSSSERDLFNYVSTIMLREDFELPGEIWKKVNEQAMKKGLTEGVGYMAPFDFTGWHVGENAQQQWGEVTTAWDNETSSAPIDIIGRRTAVKQLAYLDCFEEVTACAYDDASRSLSANASSLEKAMFYWRRRQPGTIEMSYTATGGDFSRNVERVNPPDLERAHKHMGLHLLETQKAVYPDLKNHIVQKQYKYWLKGFAEISLKKLTQLQASSVLVSAGTFQEWLFGRVCHMASVKRDYMVQALWCENVAKNDLPLLAQDTWESSASKREELKTLLRTYARELYDGSSPDHFGFGTCLNDPARCDIRKHNPQARIYSSYDVNALSREMQGLNAFCQAAYREAKVQDAPLKPTPAFVEDFDARFLSLFNTPERQLLLSLDSFHKAAHLAQGLDSMFGPLAHLADKCMRYGTVFGPLEWWGPHGKLLNATPDTHHWTLIYDAEHAPYYYQEDQLVLVGGNEFQAQYQSTPTYVGPPTFVDIEREMVDTLWREANTLSTALFYDVRHLDYIAEFIQDSARNRILAIRDIFNDLSSATLDSPQAVTNLIYEESSEVGRHLAFLMVENWKDHRFLIDVNNALVSSSIAGTVAIVVFSKGTALVLPLFFKAVVAGSSIGAAYVSTLQSAKVDAEKRALQQAVLTGQIAKRDASGTWATDPFMLYSFIQLQREANEYTFKALLEIGFLAVDAAAILRHRNVLTDQIATYAVRRFRHTQRALLNEADEVGLGKVDLPFVQRLSRASFNPKTGKRAIDVHHARHVFDEFARRQKALKAALGSTPNDDVLKLFANVERTNDAVFKRFLQALKNAKPSRTSTDDQIFRALDELSSDANVATQVNWSQLGPLGKQWGNARKLAEVKALKSTQPPSKLDSAARWIKERVGKLMHAISSSGRRGAELFWHHLAQTTFAQKNQMAFLESMIWFRGGSPGALDVINAVIHEGLKRKQLNLSDVQRLYDVLKRKSLQIVYKESDDAPLRYVLDENQLRSVWHQFDENPGLTFEVRRVFNVSDGMKTFMRSGRVNVELQSAFLETVENLQFTARESEFFFTRFDRNLLSLDDLSALREAVLRLRSDPKNLYAWNFSARANAQRAWKNLTNNWVPFKRKTTELERRYKDINKLFDAAGDMRIFREKAEAALRKNSEAGFVSKGEARAMLKHLTQRKGLSRLDAENMLYWQLKKLRRLQDNLRFNQGKEFDRLLTENRRWAKSREACWHAGFVQRQTGQLYKLNAVITSMLVMSSSQVAKSGIGLLKNGELRQEAFYDIMYSITFTYMNIFIFNKLKAGSNVATTLGMGHLSNWFITMMEFYAFESLGLQSEKRVASQFEAIMQGSKEVVKNNFKNLLDKENPELSAQVQAIIERVLSGNIEEDMNQYLAEMAKPENKKIFSDLPHLEEMFNNVNRLEAEREEPLAEDEIDQIYAELEQEALIPDIHDAIYTNQKDLRMAMQNEDLKYMWGMVPLWNPNFEKLPVVNQTVAPVVEGMKQAYTPVLNGMRETLPFASEDMRTYSDRWFDRSMMYRTEGDIWYLLYMHYAVNQLSYNLTCKHRFTPVFTNTIGLSSLAYLFLRSWGSAVLVAERGRVNGY